MNTETRNVLSQVEGLQSADLAALLQGIQKVLVDQASAKWTQSRELREGFTEAAKEAVKLVGYVIDEQLPGRDTIEAYFTKKNGTSCQSVCIGERNGGAFRIKIVVEKVEH